MAPGEVIVVDEHRAILWAILTLVGILVVALIDLHFRWAERMEDRQHDLEERIAELERERKA